MYKNRVLLSFHRIILDVIKTHVDNEVFLVRIKEVSGWILTFTCDTLNSIFEYENDHGHFEDEGSLHSLHDKEDISFDPFGIYETMENMKNDEAKNNVIGDFRGGFSGVKSNEANDEMEGYK